MWRLSISVERGARMNAKRRVYIVSSSTELDSEPWRTQKSMTDQLEILLYIVGQKNCTFHHCNNFVYSQSVFITFGSRTPYRKFATRRCIISPPNTICVTTLPCKNLITIFPMFYPYPTLICCHYEKYLRLDPIYVEWSNNANYSTMAEMWYMVIKVLYCITVHGSRSLLESKCHLLPRQEPPESRPQLDKAYPLLINNK